MNIRNLFSLSLLLAATAGFGQDSAQSELSSICFPTKRGGAVPSRSARRCRTASHPSTSTSTATTAEISNAPLLVSSKGRYVWCEKAFRFAFKDKTLRVTSAGNAFRYGQAGQNSRDTYRHAAKSFFPTDGKLPDLALSPRPSTTPGSS